MRDAARSAPAVAIASLLAAAGSPAVAENLADAWQMAAEHDHKIEAAAADVETARALEAAARAERLPGLSANGGYTRFSTAPEFRFSSGGSTLQAPLFSGDDFTSAGISVNVPIFTGGRVRNSIAAARHGTEGATEAERVERAAMRLEVTRAYIDVLRARRHLETAESAVTSLSAHVSDVASLVERELVARSDLLAARVSQANAEQERVRAANASAIAEAAYNRRLGRSLDHKPDLDSTLPPAVIDDARAVEDIVAQALQSRAELRVMASRADELERRSQAERGAMLPQVSISGGYTYLDNQILDRKDFSLVGVGVSWSLYDGGQSRHRSASLRAASRAASGRLRDLESMIELEVREAWLSVRDARARVAAASETVSQADENLRISRELYGSGLGTNTQVLEAVALQLAAANNRENAALDEVLARYELTYAAGAL